MQRTIISLLLFVGAAGMGFSYYQRQQRIGLSSHLLKLASVPLMIGTIILIQWMLQQYLPSYPRYEWMFQSLFFGYPLGWIGALLYDFLKKNRQR